MFLFPSSTTYGGPPSPEGEGYRFGAFFNDNSLFENTCLANVFR